jgi:hypothetical protein
VINLTCLKAIDKSVGSKLTHMSSVGTYVDFRISEFIKLKMYVVSNIFDAPVWWVPYFLMQCNSITAERWIPKTFIENCYSNITFDKHIRTSSP